MHHHLSLGRKLMPTASAQIWCAAAAVLPDGRLCVVGGGCYSCYAWDGKAFLCVIAFHIIS